MSFLLRYQVRQGQKWREHHKLIQVEQAPGKNPSGLENEWYLTQHVLEVQNGLCRVSWKRDDVSPLDSDTGGSPTEGELWIDNLGRCSFDQRQWSPPLFPEEGIEVEQVWTQEATAAGLPIHYTLEKLEQTTVHLVSYTQSQEPGVTREIRGAVVLCRETGRLQSSTTVTKLAFRDGRAVQSVIEVQSEEL